jgi:hypothetical protein
MTDPASPSPPPWYHAVRFYDDAKSLAQIVAAFLSEGLADDHPGIVVATAAHRAAIIRELVGSRWDVVRLQGSGDLVLLDAQDTLDTFMIDGAPDAVRFKDAMCEVIKKACQTRTNCTVRIYGEMVDILWKEGKQEAAVRLEMLWNQLGMTEGFSLLCGYAMGSFYKDVRYEDVCSQHTHVVSEDGTPGAAA